MVLVQIAFNSQPPHSIYNAGFLSAVPQPDAVHLVKDGTVRVATRPRNNRLELMYTRKDALQWSDALLGKSLCRCQGLFRTEGAGEGE